MNKKMSKRQKDMKSKLMAAICMLLVSSIMMVSTTYAWFTLSTAPEVTGITTAVGANGNLEMALLPTNGLNAEAKDDFGIQSKAGDSMAVQPTKDANITWGNLVNLTTNYGLENITLYPAALNESGEGVNKQIFLKTPTYGADGRVAELLANTVNGVYSGSAFVQSDNGISNPAGVRAIGKVSGLSEQQIAYRDAKSQAMSVASSAGLKAKNSLLKNGDGLGTIVMKKANDSGSYSTADLDAIEKLLTALDAPLNDIESSIRWYAYAWEIYANKAGYEEQKGKILGTDTENKFTLDNLVSKLTTEEGKTVPATLNDMITALKTTRGNVTSANDALTSLKGQSKTSYTWEELNDILKYLVDVNKIQFNGVDMQGASKDDLIGTVISGDKIQAVITLKTGSGVYADIADHVGDYTAVINIDASSIMSALKSPVPCTIQTSAKAPTYQTSAETAFAAIAPEGESTTTKAISEVYGYVIDLAFKTNASNSSLLLQSEAIDRIYNGDNSANSSESTMGNGSTMHFESQSQNFTNDQMTALMQNIRVVFFDPATGEIKCYAILDTDAGNLATGTGLTYQLVVAEKQDDGSLKAKTKTTGEGDEATTTKDNTIMELTQNTATRLSVLVYLDGEKVTNKDVAFDSKASMKGSLNLQFASSANLVPMVYSDFKEGSTSDATPTLPAGAEELNVDNVSTGYTAKVGYLESGGDKTVYALIQKDGKIVTGVTGDSAGVTVAGQTAAYDSTTKMWKATVTDKPTGNVDVTITGTPTLEADASATYTVTLAGDSVSGVTLKDAKVEGTTCTFQLEGTSGDKSYTVTYSMGDTTNGNPTESGGTYTINNVTGNITIKVVENNSEGS